jgi:hypothetical protein
MLSNGADTRYLEKLDGRYRLIAALPFFQPNPVRP